MSDKNAGGGFIAERYVVVTYPGRQSRSHDMLNTDSITSVTGRPVIEIATSADTAAYCGELQDIVEPGDAIIVKGGDGTTHHVGKAILELPASTTDHTPLLPVWAGSACDVACMLNGNAQLLNRYYRDQLRLLRETEIMDSWPMTSRMAYQDGGTTDDIGLYGITFGLSAKTSNDIMGPSHRESRLRELPFIGLHAQEAVTALRAIRARTRFIDITNNFARLRTERLFAGGGRMARHFRLPSRLDEPEFFETTIDRGDLPHLALQIAKLVVGKPEGRMATTSQFTVGSPTWCQHDGEPTLLPANTDVAIGVSPRPLKLLTTRLHAVTDTAR